MANAAISLWGHISGRERVKNNENNNVKCSMFRKLVKPVLKIKEEELRTNILHTFSYPSDQLLYLKFMKSLRKEDIA